MDTYATLQDAAAALSKAAADYIEARYLNYRERLVSVDGAVKHSVDDARTLVDAAIDDGSMALQHKIVEGLVH